MKALFVCKGELRYSFPHVAAELKRAHGWDVDAVTFNTPTIEVVRGPGRFGTVYNVAEHLKRFYPRHSYAECVKMLSAVECDTELNLYTLIYADRILRDYPFERAVRLLAGVYDFWQTVLPDAAPDAIYSELSTATEWLGTVLARRRGIRPLLMYPTPVTDRFYFVDSAQGIWEPMRRAYLALRNAELSPDRRRRADEWLTAFHRGRVKPPFFTAGALSPFNFHPGRFLRRVGRIPFRVRTWWQDGFYEIGSYHGTHPFRSVWSNWASAYRHALARFNFRPAVTADKYVYFPLHVQPEYTTDVRAPFFTNQIALIETMAKSIPIGYRLVIKEHPGMQGERELGYYRALKKLFNVELVAPSVDSHQLILKADAIATITGTTAWESILYQKPVVAFGNLCYGFYDLIHHCPDVRDFPAAIRAALADGPADRQLLLKFVSTLLETAHEGTINDPLRSAAVNAPDNVAKMARAIVREMGRDAEPAGVGV
jgi:hypothetical protein